MNRNKLVSIAASLAIVTIGIAGACSSASAPDAKANTFFGPSFNFGQGTARAWVTVDAGGAPSALGITLSEQALVGLPATATPPNPTAIMASLVLPEQAKMTGFDHAEVGWNPQGHDPLQLYGVPHFDFHFYTVSSATQMAILPSDPQFATKAANFPTAPYVPAGYVPPPGPAAANAIPQMGVHWTSTSAPELNGQPFSSTFIYGSWDGRFIFVEPMITKAYLETHPNVTSPIAQPTTWAAPGYYPTSFTVDYDPTAKEYRIVLGGLTKRAD